MFFVVFQIVETFENDQKAVSKSRGFVVVEWTRHVPCHTVLPGMVEYVFSPSGMSGVFFEFYKLCYNAVWIFVLASFCLAAVGCATGQMYKLPYIGDAADMRI